MQCSMGDPDYAKMHSAIKSAIEEYATAHPERHVAVELTMKLPSDDDGRFQIVIQHIQAGDASITQPEQVDLDDIESENDGHDPGKRLLKLVMQLGQAGHRVDALELAQRAVDRFPSSPFAYLCLAVGLTVNNKDSDGISALKTAVSLLDTDEWAVSHTEYQLEQRLQIGQYFRAFRDMSGARQQFEKAIEIADAAGLPAWSARAKTMIEYLERMS